VSSWLSTPVQAALRGLPAAAPIPRGADAVFGVALRNCSAAALDELMGLRSQAVQRYAKVLALCGFGHVCDVGSHAGERRVLFVRACGTCVYLGVC